MRAQTRAVVRWSGIAMAVALAVGLAGFGFDRHTVGARVRAEKDDLALLMTLRRSTLRQYWDTVQAEVVFWSMAPVVRQSLADFRQGWKALGDGAEERLRRLYLHENPHPLGERRELVSADDGSAYDAAHAALHPVAKRFVEYRDYYDFFLISPDGDVLYTVEKEDDFATSLVDGAWRDTGLADAFLRARDEAADGTVVFTDLARYGPSADEPAMFCATAIWADGGELLGVFAVQLPIERLREIMQFTAGMGESGETYLVGEDLLMRSDSRFSEESTILRTTVDTETVRRALRGETGVDVTDDYRGIPVLSAYAPIDHAGKRWAVMAEIDRAEVLGPVRSVRQLLVLGGLGAVALCLASVRVLTQPGS
jgi:methyl-accepting chemotaxis protein